MSVINPSKITYKGQPVQLVGRSLMLNKPAPNFILVTNKMTEVNLAHFKNKIKVITTLASLDTPVCESQAKEFNKSAAVFAPNIVVMLVSKDLPYAQERFCANYNINNLITLSDYKYNSLGINYGLLIKELNLLARAVFILDANNIIRYFQVGTELANQLNYVDILNKLNEVIQSGPLNSDSNLSKKCDSCETKTAALARDVINEHLNTISGWQLVDDKKIIKGIKFYDFKDAKYFLDLLALIAEEQGHHPTFSLTYNKLKITLTTHAIDGLTASDFIMAQIIDEIKI